MTQLHQGGGGAEEVIHATSRGSSCKGRPPVLQPHVTGAAKADRRCFKSQAAVLQHLVAGAARAGRRSCKGWLLVLQASGHQSCKA